LALQGINRVEIAQKSEEHDEDEIEEYDEDMAVPEEDDVDDAD